MSTDELDPRESDAVLRVYRKLPQDQPAPALDAKILAAARAAVRPRGAQRPRWLLPVASAAIVILAVGVAVPLRERHPVLDAAPVATDAVVTPAPALSKRETPQPADAGRAAEFDQALAEEVLTDDRSNEGQRQQEADVTTAGRALSSTTESVEFKQDGETELAAGAPPPAPPASPAPPTPVAQQAPSTSPKSVSATAPATPATSADGAVAADATADAAMALAEPEPAPAERARPDAFPGAAQPAVAQPAPVEHEIERRKAVTDEPARRDALGGSLGLTGSRAEEKSARERPANEQAAPDEAEVQLAQIRQLREAGDELAARAALSVWIETWPAREVPEDLRDLL